MSASTCAVCGRQLNLFNRAGNTGLCIRDYRKKTLYYDYFDIHHPTCEAATERHVNAIFGRVLLLVLTYVAVTWLGTMIFGSTAGWLFMAAGLYLGFLAGYPSKRHPVDKMRYMRFFGVFTVAVLIGTLLAMLLTADQAQAQANIAAIRLYPHFLSLFPAVIIALIAVYAFVKRDETVSDNAYSEWQENRPIPVDRL